MTRTTQAATSDQPAQFAALKRTEIKPSPTNPRRFFNPEHLNELAESIRTQGILEPILVRPVNNHHEIVAGERRWRAAELAGLNLVPAIIRDMTDDQVLDAQIHENLHRADVHPMDEAFGYQHLLKVVEGLNVEELARRVGKSAKYVAQRLSLVTLIEPVVRDFMEGLITLGHAAQIARLAPEVQHYALDACYQQDQKWDGKQERWIYTPNKEKESVNVGNLTGWIRQHLNLDLTKVPQLCIHVEVRPRQSLTPSPKWCQGIENLEYITAS